MKTLIHMQFGSHVYGTNVPTSDTDYKAIHIPEANDILLQRVRPSINTTRSKAQGERNTKDDIDFESFALQKFMSMLLEGQTVAMSMIFTPKQWWVECSPEWEFILDNKDQWLHKKVQAFAGYCRQQANKYGIKGSRVNAARAAVECLEAYKEPAGAHLIKLKEIWGELEDVFTGMPHCEFILEDMRNSEQKVRMLSICDRKVQENITVKEAHKIFKRVFDEYGARALQAENNENVDWKAMMHATRVSYEAQELLMTSHITYPRPEADLLLQIRKGEIPYKEVAELLEDRLEILEEVAKNSSLPESGNEALAYQFVAQAYKRIIYEA